ncbi:hypothetical protein DVH24_033714 [Malus domestica]|uniref:Uncharacterized protein n=1 Tax=Malus domestica TaxID=3750 RepID=A0A498HL14_MALDO|nr:hypothetical protein DVH24_033714 [Malus domestica]
MISEVRIETRSSSSRARISVEQKEKKARREEEGNAELARGNDGGSWRLSRGRSPELTDGLVGRRKKQVLASPVSSPVQSSPVPPKEVKQTPPNSSRLTLIPFAKLINCVHMRLQNIEGLNVDTLLYIFNIGHLTSSGAKRDQTDEFWSNSNWRMFVCSLACSYQNFSNFYQAIIFW